MKLISAYQKIQSLEASVFRTNDIAVILGVSNKYAYNTLAELAQEKMLLHLRRDLWAHTNIDPLLLPDYLTAPMPSYISLQSALYHHGMISQIPSVIYAVSIARTRRYETPIATYSLHHLKPELFLGFETLGKNAIHMAEPEKALFDFFYFKSTKTQLFYKLPELELPSGFSRKKCQEYAELIENKSRQRMVLSAIEHLLS